MKRIVPGLVMAACWLVLLLNGSYIIFWAVVVIIGVLGSREFLKMTLRAYVGKGDRRLLTAVLALPVFMVGVWYEAGICGGLFLSFFLSLVFILLHYSRLEDSLIVLSRLVLGCLYVGFFPAHLILLYLLPEGNYWLIILVAVTAGSDSGAYFFGKTFGKHKLCPNVSPNKTIEGAVGGVLSGVIIAVVFAALLLQNINWIILVPVAIILSGVGIVGDLCESIIKRGTDTKDSGRLLLGHGGILDRIDSLILAAPALYYIHIFTG